MQFLQLILAFAIICGTHAGEVFLNREQKKHQIQPLHALSFSVILPTPVSLNFFKCQLTGVRNATSYPETNVCITLILSWQSSLQHKYHGV